MLKEIGYIFNDEDVTYITEENQFFVLISTKIYWLYEGKYVIFADISFDRTSVDELILLAKDIVFDKHKLR